MDVRIGHLTLLCLAVLVACAPAVEPTPPPLIAKQPVYVAKPRYARFELAADPSFRVWAVLDQSAPDGDHFDVLYLDLDGDGDLTEEGERFATTYRPSGDPAGLGVAFSIGDVSIPGRDETHTRFLLATKPKKGRSGVWFRMHWRDEVEVSGGYGLTGLDTTPWAETPEDAPLLRPIAEGPFAFATWGAKEHVLQPGHPYHVNVLVGVRGEGERSFCVVDEDFLDLDLERLWVTVIARDAGGREVRERSRIKGHC